jgi:Protein of unknown function (DUF3047)
VYFDRDGIRAATVGGRSGSQRNPVSSGSQAATWVDMRRSPGPFRLTGFLKRLPFAVAVLVVCSCTRASPLALIVLISTGWDAGAVPAGWQIKANHGRPEISPCEDDNIACVHLKSVKSSFALQRGVDIDPAEMPYLTWRWKVSHLPTGGDFRRAATDDQAAQVLVAFADRRVLAYIWDTTAPKGTMKNASSIPLLRVFAVVCQSGTAALDRWITESRNVAADYERAYGKPAPHVKGIRLQINSQHTGSTAESYFGEAAFLSTPQ